MQMFLSDEYLFEYFAQDFYCIIWYNMTNFEQFLKGRGGIWITSILHTIIFNECIFQLLGLAPGLQIENKTILIPKYFFLQIRHLFILARL